jgi:hypothetical protein
MFFEYSVAKVVLGIVAIFLPKAPDLPHTISSGNGSPGPCLVGRGSICSVSQLFVGTPGYAVIRLALKIE